MSREVLISATDSSKLDMLSCREETAARPMASKDLARVQTSASPVDCGVSSASGRFVSPLLPIAP